MKEEFIGFYRPSEEEIENAWRKGLFVLDTNVLLNLYRYPKQASKDLLEILSHIQDRLWVPHQVILEYQQRRLVAIAEQLKYFDDVKKLLQTDIQSKLHNSFSQWQLQKRHSTIDPTRFLERIDTVIKDFLGELDHLEREQPDVYSQDAIREQLENLLVGKIGSPPKSQKDLDAIYKEGADRYRMGCPPGYKDSQKAGKSEIQNAYVHKSLYFKREFGDLLLWYQLIDYAKEQNVQHIIFVTDDQKEDWWWIENSRGPKTIGPRPELVDELNFKASVNVFLMYTSERFLDYASKQFQIAVEPTSVEEVREAIELSKRQNHSDMEEIKSALEQEDAGYLDYLDIAEANFGELTTILTRMAGYINDIGRKVSKHTDDLNLLSSSKEKLGAKDAKAIVNNAAKDLDQFATQMEIETPGFAQKYNSAIRSLMVAVTLVEESSREKPIRQSLDSIGDLITAIETTTPSVSTMRDAIAHLPRLTKSLNSAKRRAVENIDRFLLELSNAKDLTIEASRYLENMLNTGE